MPADPLANVFIGVDQRRARHELLARAEIDMRHGVGVTQRRCTKIEDHRTSLVFVRAAELEFDGLCIPLRYRAATNFSISAMTSPGRSVGGKCPAPDSST